MLCGTIDGPHDVTLFPSRKYAPSKALYHTVVSTTCIKDGCLTGTWSQSVRASCRVPVNLCLDLLLKAGAKLTFAYVQLPTPQVLPQEPMCALHRLVLKWVANCIINAGRHATVNQLLLTFFPSVFTECLPRAQGARTIAC